MIDLHFEALERAIINDPLVISTDVHRAYTSPMSTYLKGEITFIDGSSLVIFQHVRIKQGRLT